MCLGKRERDGLFDLAGREGKGVFKGVYDNEEPSQLGHRASTRAVQVHGVESGCLGIGDVYLIRDTREKLAGCEVHILVHLALADVASIYD